jgi:hypothetical protein
MGAFAVQAPLTSIYRVLTRSGLTSLVCVFRANREPAMSQLLRVLTAALFLGTVLYGFFALVANTLG